MKLTRNFITFIAISLILVVVLTYLFYGYITTKEQEQPAQYVSTIPTSTEIKPSIELLYYPERAECFKKVEVGFNITGLAYRNPFNSSDINVFGCILTPNGREIHIPAFYTRNYTLRPISDGQDPFITLTNSYWALRFTPTEAGVYRVSIKAVNGEGLSAELDDIEIRVELCKVDKGFASLDKRSGYIVFSDNTSEIMLGLNVAWPPSKGRAISFYKRWFERLRELGVRVVRIGLVPWALNLEWDSLNSYNMIDAIKLDKIVELAEENDIYIVFVFMWHNELADNWNQNPYNVARGGPIKSPREFWSNRIAIDIFKDRVRYIIARWGYSKSILVWELINEADLTTEFSTAKDQFVEWVREIGSYVKMLDPYKRAVTVSLADYNSEPRVWTIDEIDIVTVHRYGPTGFKDIASTIPSIIESLSSRYGKPVVITEFGVDYRWYGMRGFVGTPYWDMDKDGVGLHEGLWSSVMSGSPISAMSWWWDTQIEKYSLFYHFNALSRFLEGIDPIRSSIRRINAYVVSASISGRNTTSIVIYPSAGWLWTSPVKNNTYTIYPNGSISGDMSILSGFIYGKWHPQRTFNPIFNTTFLDYGRILLRINSVGRGSAKLVVYVDGEKRLERLLPDRDGKGDEDANEYGEIIEIPISPGRHEIIINNDGNDWFTWDYIVFENVAYASANVQVLGLGNNTFTILWVRNRDYNWWNLVVEKKIPETIEHIVIRVDGIDTGMYTVELWDTYRGEILNRFNTKAVQGVIEINIGNIASDVAIRIYKEV